jgi:predicted CoA-binding protein
VAPLRQQFADYSPTIHQRFTNDEVRHRTLYHAIFAEFKTESAWQGLLMESDESLKELLQNSRTIAVVGIKGGENEDAFRVPRYLQQAGYRILPVNPKLSQVLGEACSPTLAEIQDVGSGIDIVNIFRASENVPGHVDEILALDPRPRAVWMQLGIHHGPSARKLRAAGILVLHDRCIMVDHRRLFETSGER